MEMPSTLGFKIQSQPFLPEWKELWEGSIDVPLIAAMEQWACASLEIKCAAIGALTLDGYLMIRHDGGPLHSGKPVIVNFLILRHKDYSTGRPNIEILIREVKQGHPAKIWRLKDDAIEAGTVTNFTRELAFKRTYDPAADEPFVEAFRLNYVYESLVDAPPLMRVPWIYKQCYETGQLLSQLLIDKIDRPGLTVDQRTALLNLFRSPMFWLAAHPAAWEELKQLTKNSVEVTRAVKVSKRNFSVEVNRTIIRDQKISEDSHVEFHEAIHDTWRSARDLFQASPSPDFSIDFLIQKHTEWVSLFQIDKLK